MDVPPQDYQSCRACRADIVFAQTTRIEKGQNVIMPVDVKPAPNGNVALAKLNGKYHAGVVGKNQAAGMRDAGKDLHTAHFATCPEAGRFRKSYGKGGKS